MMAAVSIEGVRNFSLTCSRPTCSAYSNTNNVPTNAIIYVYSVEGQVLGNASMPMKLCHSTRLHMHVMPMGVSNMQSMPSVHLSM